MDIEHLMMLSLISIKAVGIYWVELAQLLMNLE